LLPRGKRSELEDHVYDLEDLDKRIKAKDITIYQDYNLWYKSIQERIRAKACQYIPIKPRNLDMNSYRNTAN